MSTFHRRTKNPVTGQFEDALWLDNYFGRWRYGVQFPDGTVYRQHQHHWEFEDTVLPGGAHESQTEGVE